MAYTSDQQPRSSQYYEESTTVENDLVAPVEEQRYADDCEVKTELHNPFEPSAGVENLSAPMRAFMQCEGGSELEPAHGAYGSHGDHGDHGEYGSHDVPDAVDSIDDCVQNLGQAKLNINHQNQGFVDVHEQLEKERQAANQKHDYVFDPLRQERPSADMLYAFYDVKRRSEENWGVTDDSYSQMQKKAAEAFSSSESGKGLDQPSTVIVDSIIVTSEEKYVSTVRPAPNNANFRPQRRSGQKYKVGLMDSIKNWFRSSLKPKAY